MSYNLANNVNNIEGATRYLLNSLSSYAPISNPAFTGTVAGITPAMVGRGNVGNTLGTPISTATQAALNTLQPALPTSLPSKHRHQLVVH